MNGFPISDRKFERVFTWLEGGAAESYHTRRISTAI